MKRTPDQIYDELLVLRCQDGEIEALEELVERWHARLWRHARRLSSTPERADDVMQEAWIAMVRGLGRLHDPALFRAWAFRIVTHKSTDQVRRSSRRQEIHEEVARQPAAFSTADLRSPDDASEGLRAAMASLPAERRALLALYYVEGLGLLEIASILDIPEGTVKSRLFKARKILKQALERSSDGILR